MIENIYGPFYNEEEKRGGIMHVEIKIDDSYQEPKIIILTATMSEEVNHIIQKLSEHTPCIISGSKDGKVTILEQDDLLSIYASHGKVFALTSQGEYILKQRLYEVEEKLNQNQFVRISNSEIIHLKKVRHFDLNFTGTICVELIDGTKTYVSRRYVSKIKKILGV